MKEMTLDLKSGFLRFQIKDLPLFSDSISAIGDAEDEALDSKSKLIRLSDS